MVVIVKTQFGYLTDSDGHIVGKCNYNVGEAQIRDDYTYTEVANQNALDAISIFQPPLTPDEKQKALNDQALQALIVQKIIDTPALSTQQLTISQEIASPVLLSK